MNPGTVVIIAIVTLIAGVAIGYGLYYFIARQANARLQIKVRKYHY